MVFLSICTALYDYVPQSEGELSIQEGEIVYILEKSTEDDWWKAKKKAQGEEEEEPMGLIPNNYVEEAQPTHSAKALYDYARQTDEELSFSEDAILSVYDTSDPDWTLVGLNGEYGFAPANYIEITQELGPTSPSSTKASSRPAQALEQGLPSTRSSQASPQSPAAALAGIIHNQATGASSTVRQSSQSNVTRSAQRPQYTPDASDEDRSTPPPPSLPERSPSAKAPSSKPQPEIKRTSVPSGVVESPPHNRVVSDHHDFEEGQPSPGGFHLYNISEMVSVMGKQKKMPTTLGINLATGKIMIAPEKSRDGPQQEWTGDKLTHYSIEGKHIFMELVKPSKSVDFHAGAKDTAQEIVSALAELAGAARAEGLREVIAASSGTTKSQRKGQILYDFMAQGDDEVTVAVGDDVIIVDDTKSEEWWMVRRLKNGKEGVVPSSYVELTGFASPVSASRSGLNAGRSTVEQNRLEEERLAKEGLKASRKRESTDGKGSEIGPGMRLPKRGSSLMGAQDNNNTSPQRSKRDSRSEGKSSTKTKPDASKTRTWTDRSGSFKVDAQFIGLKDGKIHLHKLNGVKIAVPVGKMAIEDLEYVERETGVSLDEDKPLSDIKRKSQKAANGDARKTSQTKSSTPKTGASVQQPKNPDYDWFDFFLKCGVSPYQCERYTFNFNRDSMDESVLPETTPAVLRTLGLKEGDIIRVMKFLDNKYGRTGAKSKLRNVSFGGEEVIGSDDGGDGSITSPSGGLFSGPGGALKNNTRKGRPAPTVQVNDTVDPNAFQQKGKDKELSPEPNDRTKTPLASAPKPVPKTANGFDDDAWDVKPSKAEPTSSPPAPVPEQKTPAPPKPTFTGSMADLSLLSEPLLPTVVHNGVLSHPSQNQPSSQQFQQPAPSPQQTQTLQPHMLQQQPLQIQQQPTGASPALFAQTNQLPTGMQQPQGFPNQPPQMQSFNPQHARVNQSSFQLYPAPRQRPAPPQMSQQGSLLPPPPPRPLSAPQNISPQNNFGPPPLQPQLTGIPNQGGFQNQMSSPGQTLNDLQNMRLQQQFNQQQQMQMQPQFASNGPQSRNPNQFTGGPHQQPGIYNQPPSLRPQGTGFQPSPLYLNDQQTVSPFADPRLSSQPTGFQPSSANLPGYALSYSSPLLPQPTGSINSVLPPALQPQQTGVNGFGRPGFGQISPLPPMPPMPSLPSQQVLAPLQPQKTGPAPPVRFGVSNEAKKLVPQPTGRANLSKATPQNPFGFE